MDEKLWKDAEVLAARPYDTEFETDIDQNGNVVYLALNPELPGCMAEGASQIEAETKLAEARVDYIYALLKEDIPVPEPTASQSTTGQSVTPQGSTTAPTTLTFVYESSEANSHPEHDTQAQHEGKKSGTQLRGDLIRHSS